MAESRVTSLSLSMPMFMDQDLAREPGLFDASLEVATRRGGPVMRAFLDRMPSTWRDDASLSLDAWATELRVGWYPCAFDWRRTGNGAQKTMMARVNGALAPVEFAEGRYNIGGDELDTGINELVRQRVMQLWTPDPRKFYVHGGYAVHRCLPAVDAGWTWTGRAMIGPRYMPHLNEVRRQSKVYIR